MPARKNRPDKCCAKPKPAVRSELSAEAAMSQYRSFIEMIGWMERQNPETSHHVPFDWLYIADTLACDGYLRYGVTEMSFHVTPKFKRSFNV